MSVTFRAGTPGDEVRLALIAAATFGFACPPDQTAAGVRDFITTHLSPERFADHLNDPARTILLAEQDGVTVGYSMLVAGPPSDPDVVEVVTADVLCELSKFYVFSGLHGQGVAGELMRVTLEAARTLPTGGVWLGVNQQNARANSFYEKHGYTIVGLKRFLVGGRMEDDYVRELRF